jgi:hypothetical protein
MSVGLATRGYVVKQGTGGGGGGQFVGSLSPDLTVQSLEPEINQVHTQGNPTNPGAPTMVVETITDLKPTMSKKPRRR